jgi:hypothetical protein
VLVLVLVLVRIAARGALAARPGWVFSRASFHRPI